MNVSQAGFGAVIHSHLLGSERRNPDLASSSAHGSLYPFDCDSLLGDSLSHQSMVEKMISKNCTFAVCGLVGLVLSGGAMAGGSGPLRSDYVRLDLGFAWQAAHPHPLLFRRGDLVADAFAGHFPLELSE